MTDAPVGHADDEAVDTVHARLVDDALHCGNQHLAPLQPKPLLRRKLLCQKLFKPANKRDLRYYETSVPSQPGSHTKVAGQGHVT